MCEFLLVTMKERQTYIIKTEDPDWWYEVSNYGTTSPKPCITIKCISRRFGIFEAVNMSRETATKLVRIILCMLNEEQE